MRMVLSWCIAALAAFFLVTAAVSAATGDQPAASPAQTRAANGEDADVKAAQRDLAAAIEQVKASEQKQIDICTAFLRCYPKNNDAYKSRADVYAEMGDYDKAIADYSEAIRLPRILRSDPKKLTEAYYSRAEVYEKHKGDHDKAIADYTEVIRLDPEYLGSWTWAYFDRGEAYEHKGDHGKAVADYTEVIRLQQKKGWQASPLFYEYRARAYTNKGEHDKAIADCNEAIRLDSGWVGAYDARGHAYANKGELDKAIADCTKAIQQDPRNADFYATRAAVYEKKGDKAKAEADRAQGKKLRSGDRDAAANKPHPQSGSSLDGSGRGKIVE